MILDLFTRCVLISLLAFGGGGAALPLIERIAVAEAGWVSAQDFATAVVRLHHARSRAHYHDVSRLSGGRLAGAFAATFGIFVMPWALAAAAAHLLRRWMQHPLLRHFGRGQHPPWSACSWSRPSILLVLPSQARCMSALPVWPWGWRCGRN